MSEQPRLLLCCFDVLPGPHGLSRRITEYLKGVGDKFQVVVLSNKTPDHSHIERYHGARLLRVPIGTGDLQSRIQAFDRAVRRQLESEEYLLVHFFDPFGGYTLCEQREQHGHRLIYDAQTFPSQELRYTNPATEGDRRFISRIRRQELFCLMNADAVITGSETTRQYVVDQGVPENLVQVIRAPVDLTPYTPQVMGKPDASPMRLLALGNQYGYQGLPTLLRALQLAMRQVDVRLVVVGPSHPDWQPPLQDLVGELKLEGKVEFQPPVPHDDVHKIVATCDVGVLPLEDNDRNRLQGGPTARLGEFLAGGRPVLAADLPITRELLPADAGVFFPCGDFKVLAERIVELAQSPGRRAQMGEAARASAVELDGDFTRLNLLKLYRQLAGQNRSSSAAATQEITLIGKEPAPPPALAPAAEEPTDSTDMSKQQERPPVLGTLLRDEGTPISPRPGPPVEDPPEPTPMGLFPGPPSPAPAASGDLEEALADALPISADEVVGEAPLADDEVDDALLDEEPLELNDDEVFDAAEDAPADERTAQAVSPAFDLPPAVQSPVELGDDEHFEASGVHEIPDEGVPLPTLLDPWLAQLVHGFCPPEGAAFERHAPPTNFPGRDKP